MTVGISLDLRSELELAVSCKANGATRMGNAIVRDPNIPDIPGGPPVFKRTRVPFQALLDYLGRGAHARRFPHRFSARRPCGGNPELEQAKSLASPMKLCCDEGVPRRFKSSLSTDEQQCATVPEAGFAEKTNGRAARIGGPEFGCLHYS
jgi:hypothetical protein